VLGGGGPSGDPGTLYLTAGGGNQPNFPTGGSTTSVFASLVPAAAVGVPDFPLTLSAPSATVAAGGSTSLTISTSAVGGFNGQISLTCSGPAGLTCALSPSTISPGSSASSSTLTVSAASTPPTGRNSLPIRVGRVCSTDSSLLRFAACASYFCLIEQLIELGTV